MLTPNPEDSARLPYIIHLEEWCGRAAFRLSWQWRRRRRRGLCHTPQISSKLKTRITQYNHDSEEKQHQPH